MVAAIYLAEAAARRRGAPADPNTSGVNMLQAEWIQRQ